MAGAAGFAICALRALRSKQRAAWAGLAASLALAALVAWQGPGFLERTYYVVLAALLMILVAEQVRQWRRIRLERDAESRRAAALAERLSEAEREGEPIIALKSGSQVHRVAENDVLFVQAADDYCEVVLASGRRLLVTMSLTRFLANMSPRFIRVHKSYAVNRAHVTGAKPKPGGGRHLVLSDQSTLPVGRSYGPAVTAWLG
jgi:DNA-binding LytR/AlgR family response regulator